MRVIQIVIIALSANVPVLVENPRNSLAWSEPAMLSLRQLPECHETILDQCQYGTKWKKGTRIVSWGASAPPSQLKYRCCPRGKVCSRTHKPHVQLQGKVPGTNLNWSALAAEYPKNLSRALAYYLVMSANNQESSVCNRLLW